MIVSVDAFLEQGLSMDEAWRAALEQWRTTSHEYPRAIVVCGAPGAGKSTVAQQQDRADRILYDSTLCKPAYRRRVVDACNAPRIDCVWVHPSLQVCLQRNAGRAEPVLEHIVRTMHAGIASAPPKRSEGFASITQVLYS